MKFFFQSPNVPTLAYKEMFFRFTGLVCAHSWYTPWLHWLWFHRPICIKRSYRL